MVAWTTRKRQPYRDLRQEMIDEAGAFITWALAQEDVPTIPVKLVEKGGFERAMKMPGARAMAARWWKKILDRLPG